MAPVIDTAREQKGRRFRLSRRWPVPLALFGAVALVYLTTISPNPSPDVFTADFAALHIARTGDPVPHIPDFPRLDDNIIRETWIVETADGREAVGRAPGVIAVAVPAYWLLRPDTVSAIPGGITAALLTAGTVTLLFLTLRERIGGRHALLAAVLFGLATPMWSVAANGVWPHTLTTFGIIGMAWAADRGAVVAGRSVRRGRAVGAAPCGRDLRRPGAGAGVAAAPAVDRVAHRRRERRDAGADVGVDALDVRRLGPERGLPGRRLHPQRRRERRRRGELPRLLGLPRPRAARLDAARRSSSLPPSCAAGATCPTGAGHCWVGGVVYLLLQGLLVRFSGGDQFYGYRTSLELLACATPALALSAARMGPVARRLFAPVAVLQFVMITPGSVLDGFYVQAADVWYRNAFVNGVVDRPVVMSVCIGCSLVVAYVFVRVRERPGSLPLDGARRLADVTSSGDPVDLAHLVGDPGRDRARGRRTAAAPSRRSSRPRR